MELNDLPGHVSYVLIAISYWATNILWLRITAVVGLLMEILYFRMSGGDLATGIYWDLVFLAINAYQLFWLYDEYRKASKLEGSSELVAGAFSGMSRLQLGRLAALGEWRSLKPGDVLCEHGAALKELVYLRAFQARWCLGREPAQQPHRGNFEAEPLVQALGPGIVGIGRQRHPPAA